MPVEMPLFPPPLAPYRSRHDKSPGRFTPEPPSATRTSFQRDRDRIIHSAAFRRLALKTQVFLPDEGDHYRTRLTHTIEVGQITRTLTRALGLDDDLGEALALAHDLGHTPFGHTGEDALDDVMRAFGGFDHNVQTIRIVTSVERRYPRVPGLNLSWEVLDGLLKRVGPRSGSTEHQWCLSDLPGFADPAWAGSFDPEAQPSGEAQAAALADDIAYNAHDLEDGLQAGLFGLGDLDAVPLLATTRDRLAAGIDPLDDELLVRGLARELVGCFVEGAVAESRRQLDETRPESVDDLRRAGRALISLPDDLVMASEAIKRFLFTRMYRHPTLVDRRARAKRIVQELATRLLERPDLLPDKWRDAGNPRDTVRHARRVTDYVASMTDRFAVVEHRRLFDATPDLS